MKVIVTGGAGFIGSAVIRQYVHDTSHEVINVDALTYAGNLESLTGKSYLCFIGEISASFCKFSS